MTPQTDRLNTALAGRYRIDRHLGEGGMASVYLCDDLKHDRKVALKLLKPELAAVLGAERFVVEIKTTASLQHPHILPLFDSGTADGFLFYVMPWIQGETLRDKLNRETQLGVDEAVKIAREVADALDYAHRHGVIHRDIKPENILLHDGRPMVADFGIALAVSAAAGGRMTETGLSLGTPHYMSPEQATAEKEITARSDVYSLGSVLFEMLTGNPPHTGASAQQIIMKIITEPAEPVTKYRKSVPPNVAAAVARSLEKLPADRFESAKAFADALANPTYTSATLTGATGAAFARSRGVSVGLFAAVCATAVVLLAITLWLATRSVPQPVASRFTLGMPDSVTLYTGGGTKLALSRDGTRLVFVGVKAGRRALYLRRIDDPVAQPVRGGDVGVAAGNISPRFSPAGDWIVFQVEQVLKKIPTAGGTAQTLADSGSGVVWGDRGTILYTFRRALWIGTSEGRDSRILAHPDTAHGVFSFVWPEVLPGGDYALVCLNRAPGDALIVDSMRLAVVSLSTGAVTDLGVYGTNPHYSSTGHIVFGRAGGLVFSAPFSLRRRAVTGPPSLLLENVWQGSGGATGFTMSDNGTLAYHEGRQSFGGDFFAVDHAGVARRLPGERLDFSAPRLSPDGKRVAAHVRSNNGKVGVSLIDLSTGAREQLTPNDSGALPEWTRDGARVVFATHLGTAGAFVSRSRDRSSPDTVLWRDHKGLIMGNLVQGVPHGLAALAAQQMREGRWAVYLTPMDSIGVLRPFAAGSSNNHSPSISADGHVLAWVSDESGSAEVYAQPIPGPGARIQVSVHGGVEPAWSRTGATLFYRAPGVLMSAEVAGSPLRVARRDSLFADTFVRVRSSSNGRNWDAFPSGKEFLMMRQPDDAIVGVYVLLNWPQLKVAQSAAAGR